MLSDDSNGKETIDLNKDNFAKNTINLGKTKRVIILILTIFY